MRKITFYLLMLLATVFSGHSQVQFGTGNNTIQNAPFSPTYWYSYSQSLYLAQEINASGAITSIQWYFTGTSPLQYSQELVIYLGHTNKSSFSSPSDWIVPANMSHVYTGGITPNGPGWVTIQLDTPFVYDGTSNLVVAVAENADGKDADSDDFYNTQVVGTRTICTFENGNPVNLNNPSEGPPSDYVPNIIFGGITQSCTTPFGVTTSAVGINTATVNWEFPEFTTIPSGGSEFYVSQTNSTPAIDAAASGSVASGTTATITTGLVPSTTYYVWVRSLCGNGNKSGWSYPAKFITPCLPVTEFYEDFDNVITPALPSCWTSIIKSGDLVPVGNSIGTTTLFVHSPPYSVGFFNYDVLDDFTLVSPNLSNLSAHTHRLKFYASKMFGGSVIEVGTLNGDGNSDASVFTPFEPVTLNEGNNEYIVDFSSYTGEDTYIGLRVPTDQMSSINVDNIIWEEVPACSDVSDILSSGITSDGAVINWSATGVEDNWEVVVGESTVSNPNTLVPMPTTATTTVLSGLVSQTGYNVWVRSVCSASEKGAWIGPVKFKTDCSAIAAFNENFDAAQNTDLPSCWSKIIKREDPSNYAAIYTTFSPMDFAPNAVEFVYAGNNVTDELILVSPNLSTLNLGTYRLKFRGKKSISGPVIIQVGTLDTNDDSAIFSQVSEITLTDITQLYKINFNEYTGPDHYVGIRLSEQSNYTEFYLDDIIWELAPTCPDISGITVPSTTANTANVEWTAGGSESSWAIAVGEAAVTDPDTLVPTTSTNPNAVVEGLADATNYKVWVRSVCSGNDNGAWMGPVDFKTDCLPVATFNENFDGISTPELPSCWSKILRGNTLSPYAFVETYQYEPVHSDPNSAVLYNANSSYVNDDIILVSPSVSTLTAGTHRLKFYAKNQGNIYGVDIQVGTLDANGEDAVFTPFEYLSITDQTAQYVVDFATNPTTDKYIGIRMNTGFTDSHVNIDNILWEVTPACPDVTATAITAIAANSVGVSWTAGGPESQWQVGYTAVDVTDPSNLSNIITVSATDASLSGLAGNTTYNVWVRSVCAENAYGAWIGPVTVTTDCEAADVSYVENFESSALYSTPVCSSMINAGAGNLWYVSDAPGDGFNSKTLTYSRSYTDQANAWFFTRGVNLTANTAYTISYNYGTTTFGTERLKIMYGNSATVEGMTELLADHSDFANLQATNESITFTPVTSGVYYFGFNAYSIAYQGYIYIDEIKVDNMLSTGGADWSGFSYYPNPVKELLTVSYKEILSNISVYNLLGQKVIDNDANSQTARINMGNLSAGTYIIKVTSGDSTKTLKIIKE